MKNHKNRKEDKQENTVNIMVNKIHLTKDLKNKAKITLIDYNQSNHNEKINPSFEEISNFHKKKSITWVNIDSVKDKESIKKIGSIFNLHPLVLEDIEHTVQRPKFEDYENYLFIVLRMIYFDKSKMVSEQVSIILGKNYVLTFQQKEGDVFDEIRKRLKENKGRIRKANSDYLAYSIIDSIIDNYFTIVEKIGDKIEDMETEILKNPQTQSLQKINSMKKEMVYLRKSVWPLRELINSMQKDESRIIKQETLPYLRNIYDHTVQVMDSIETSRDLLSGMHDIYLSSISNKMNEVMKVLTVFAAIFIPLTFIAGVYGMNFDTSSPFNMPELLHPYGYLIVWGIMIVVAGTMLIFFKKKKYF